MRKISHTLALCAALAVTACINAATHQPCVDPTTNTTSTNAAAASAPAAGSPPSSGGDGGDMITGTAPKACGGEAKPASDGLIDNFEDEDNQLAKLGGRDGYWWTAADPNGSTIEPKKVVATPGGAGSPKALNFKGVTSSANGAWGVNFGVNFMSEKVPYDGSQYAGISFKAKVGPNSTKKIRFKIGDINTHQDAGVCKSCWNHFGKDVELSEQWQEVKVLFTDAKQADGWGQPRPANITTDKLWNIDFSIGPAATYDLWIDDVQFLACP
jgi:hypothetical protein